MEECRYCHENQVVPVLDKKMEQQPRAGNKYRRSCLSCGRWLPMCSAEYYRAHHNPHVLPIGESEIVPLSEVDVTEKDPMSGHVGRDTKDGDTPWYSSDGHDVVRDRETRDEILIECVLDMIVEGFLDKETATQYLSQRFSEANS